MVRDGVITATVADRDIMNAIGMDDLEVLMTCNRRRAVHTGMVEVDFKA